MFMPNKNNLVIDIVRRCYNSNDSVKKCKSWTITKCKDWLVNNPVTELNDIPFLLHEEGLFSEIVKQSNKEGNKVKQLIEDDINDSWYGIEP